MRSDLRSTPFLRRECLRQMLFGISLTALKPSMSQAKEPPILVHSDLVSALKDVELAMQFSGSTAAECRVWQKKFQEKLNELLGESNPPKKWTVVEESFAEFDSLNAINDRRCRTFTDVEELKQILLASQKRGRGSMALNWSPVRVYDARLLICQSGN